MSQQQVADVSVAAPNTEAAATDIISHGQQSTLARLARAYDAHDALTFLGDSLGDLTLPAISQLGADVDSDATHILLSGPYTSEHSVMRQVIAGIGFDAKDLSVRDLENVFTMFLSFQKSHQQRTILLFSETQHCAAWLLDRIRWFVQQQIETACGLMTVVAGRTSLAIEVNPVVLDEGFSLTETRLFVRTQIEASGTSDIAQMFEFDAITLIHELSSGDEAEVSSLYGRCLQLASITNTRPITVAMVRDAHTAPDAIEQAIRPRRLTVRINGEITRHLPLDTGHILIGRDQLCDIRVPSRAVSRHHALIVNSANGITIIDLGSTNGTFVDGHKVCQFELTSSGIVTVGDCNMEYAAAEESEAWQFDLESANDAESADSHHATQTLKCDIKGNINTKGEKIYHVIGTALYDKTQIDEEKGERWFHSEEEAQAAGWRKSRR